MKRREFIALIARAATAWPCAAHAQQQDRVRRLRVLMGNQSNDPVGKALAAALVQGLGALDWHGGDNLRIEWRWGGGEPRTFPPLCSGVGGAQSRCDSCANQPGGRGDTPGDENDPGGVCDGHRSCWSRLRRDSGPPWWQRHRL